AALQQAHGEFVVLLDHDDVLAAHALFEVVSVVHQYPDVELIYSDEDKLQDGYRVDPFFKPDWSPEMMLCVNQITHLCAFRRTLVTTVGFFDPEMDGAQDWDFFLRISEHTDKIYHIPKILYHWRQIAGSTATDSSNK